MAVEILGRACVAPSAKDAQELLSLLKNGTCAVTYIPDERWNKARFWHPARSVPGKAYTFAAGVIDDIFEFDFTLFGLSAREAAQMDPQQRVLLQTIWRAVEDAGIDLKALRKERVGVYIGASSLDSGNLRAEDPAAGSPHFMTGNTLSIISNRISHIFGLNGPSMTIDTACSSSLVALHEARKALEDGEIDTAIVGGVNILLHPFSFIGFSQARMLSPEGLCRAYGENGEGYVRAEAAGAVVLRTTERVSSAGGRSRATLVATGLNTAGRTNGISLPSREAQAQLLKSVYDDNGIDRKDLVFIEGHGTGTKVGDPAELWAIGSVLAEGRKEPLPIGSIKSNIGHAEPVSGILGLIKAMLALENDFIPASLHADNLTTAVDFDELNIEVNRATKPLGKRERKRLVGINSFGFGGTNAHVVIADPTASVTTEASDRDLGMFTVSAHTPSALRTLIGEYHARLLGGSEEAIRALLATGKNTAALKHRFVAQGRTDNELVRSISDYLVDGNGLHAQTGEMPGRVVKTAFIYAGNGSQWAGMGIDAYRENPGFRAHFDRFSSLFAANASFDLVKVLHSGDLEVQLRDTRVAQPILFAVQAALTDCLVDSGVIPDVVCGHSIGEVAAAYAAGILSAEDAATIVRIRSKHQHSLAGKGSMAAALMSEATANAFTEEHGLTDIRVAGVNAHNSVTVSGPVEDIQKFKALAQAARYAVHVLDIDYPFHHPVIDAEQAAFMAEIPALAPKTGHTPFISTVTGDVIEGPALDARYWWRNIREPIAFEAAITRAIEAGSNLFLEISPRSILSTYVTETGKQASASIAVLSTLTKSRLGEGSDPVMAAMVRAVAHGVDLQTASAGIIVPVNDGPVVPFEPVICRPASTSDSLNIFGRDGADGDYSLLGWRSDPNASVWKNHIDAQLFPDLAGHLVDGKSIMPGSAFVEIALQAARQYYDATDIEITNLEIFRPLELRDNKLSELSTQLSPETGFIQIASREYLSNDGFTVHATARSRRPTERLPAKRLLPATTVPSHQITGEEAYQTAHSFGLDYATCFQLLDKAEVFDGRQVVVKLKPSAKPRHPYLTYGLDPVSTDAAFHGLVALFGVLTGEDGGAPYIPVRFGAVRMSGSGKAIARAIIEVQRFSPHSLKARIDLIAEDGTLVAALDDCRFRRTWLRQHTTLESVTFHYEAVPADLQGAVQANAFNVGTSGILSGSSEGETSDATLILDAAVQRACYDIATQLSGKRGTVSLSALPGSRAFQCHLSSCLYGLEDAGLATPTADGWTISATCDLPPLETLLRQINTQFPERVAEAVLINNSYRETLDRLTLSETELEIAESETFLSEATLEHVRHHTALARTREKLVLDAVEKALKPLAYGDVFTVVEAGAVSPAFSQRLADLVGANGGRLVIVEPSDHLRRTLEIGFERNPSVMCLDPAAPISLSNVNLVVSAGGYLMGTLGRSEGLRSVLESAAVSGGRVVAAELGSSAFADFAFGLTSGWFAESATSEFPIGLVSTETQWLDLLHDCGFQAPELTPSQTPDGSLLLVEAAGKAATEAPTSIPTSFATLINVAHRNGRSPILAGEGIEQLECTAETASQVFAEFFAEKHALPLAFVFEAQVRGTTSLALQDDVLILSALAEAVRRRKSSLQVTLVIAAAGAAPAGSSRPDATASGIWTFARVLQNEYDELDVILVDPASDPALRQQALITILSTTQVEKEWVQNARTGALSVVRAVPGPLQSVITKTSDFESATIRQISAGRIDSIRWEETAKPKPGPNQVAVEVSATGLNFRDVMWSMGLLPEEALEDGFAGATIGMEMAGTVVSVGEGVTDLSPGDPVMGIVSKALSTHVVVARDGVTKIPEGIDRVAAATVPVAFLTAYYAMVELGRIRRGDTILIHGAAGGVGLAALQIAKLNGATVIATAGTVEKRRFLTLLGADHVFDSRSLSFVEDVRRVTHGQGVELVLNSLFAEAMERSFELLKPFGRFLELGKRDYYSDRKLALRPFRRNISYFGIDADQLLVNEPALTRRIFSEVGALFAEGKLFPLPYRAFNHDETATAFRLMQNSGHIGKIVIRPPHKGKDAVHKHATERLKLQAGIYVVVGGIGGFGLAAADWLASRGASHVALISRAGVPDEATLSAIAKWNAAGVCSSFYACDVTDKAALDGVLNKLRRIGPLKGVVHAAMVLDDGLISNLDRQRNRAVIAVKADGALNLDRMTSSDALDLFLMFSSATTMIGNPGQANYVAANGYLEGLARARRAEGLPGLAIGFGAIADAGFLSRNTQVKDILARRIGKTALKAKNALQFVEEVMLNDTGAVDAAAIMVAEIDWTCAGSLAIAAQPLFSAIPRHSVASAGAIDGDEVDLAALVAGKTRDEAVAILHTFLAADIASILKVAEDSIKSDTVLKDIGLDSLMAMELGTGFHQKTGIDIPLSGMGDSATVRDIVLKLHDKVVSSAAADQSDEAPEDASLLTQLTEKHVANTQERKSA